MGNCHTKIPKEKRAEFMSELNAHTERLGKFLYTEGFCPVCSLEFMLKAVFAHMRTVSNVTDGDAIQASLDAVSAIWEVPLIAVDESEVQHNDDGSITIASIEPKGRPH